MLLSGPASAATVPPTIDAQWVSNASEHGATLHAAINPNGLLTKYKLQIDITGNFKFDQSDGCVLHPPGVFCTQAIVPGEPQPPGLLQPPESTLPAGTGSQHVSVNLASIASVLQPSTTYHYRAIAANGLTVVEGPDLTFTTPPLLSPPSIDETSATDITPTSATLNASIDPNGLLTRYKLQIDITGNFKFDQSDGCVLHPPGIDCTQEMVPGETQPPGLIEPPEMSLPAQFGAELVSVDLAELGAALQPDTTYHYRAIAANTAGFVASSDQTFKTPPEQIVVIDWWPPPDQTQHGHESQGDPRSQTPVEVSAASPSTQAGIASPIANRPCPRKHRARKARPRAPRLSQHAKLVPGVRTFCARR